MLALRVWYNAHRDTACLMGKAGYLMPAQEERLSTLEQTVTALSRDVRDINHNETILLGMAMKQEEHTREIRSSLASLSEHLDTFERSVNSRFEVLETTLGEHTTLLAQILARLPEKP